MLYSFFACCIECLCWLAMSWWWGCFIVQFIFSITPRKNTRRWDSFAGRDGIRNSYTIRYNPNLNPKEIFARFRFLDITQFPEERKRNPRIGVLINRHRKQICACHVIPVPREMKWNEMRRIRRRLTLTWTSCHKPTKHTNRKTQLRVVIVDSMFFFKFNDVEYGLTTKFLFLGSSSPFSLQ